MVQAGDALLFESLILHASRKARSFQPRMFFTWVRWCVGARVTCVGGGYLMSGHSDQCAMRAALLNSPSERQACQRALA